MQQRSIYLMAAAILALLVAPLPAGAQQRGKAAAAPPVATAVVSVVPSRERVAAVGSARSRRQVTVTTRVAGVIAEVLFEGGKKVAAGEVLVRLTSEPEQIAVETALAQREQAANTVERYRQLNSAAVSRVAMAEAETTLKVADAALRKARDDLERLTIKAPFAGMMGLTNLQVGDYIAVGTPIATLDDRSTLLVEFTVPEAVAPAMRKGLPVRANLITRSGEIYSGRIETVGTRIDPMSRTLSVRAAIPNEDLKLIPGSTFSISVQLTGEALPVVPGLAVQWDRRGAFVWRIGDNNTVQRVDIAIVARNGDRVQVDAPLKEGERIIEEGGDALRQGQRVRVPAAIEAGAEPPARGSKSATME